MSNLHDSIYNLVKERFTDLEGSHDWFHIERVYKNALLISKNENVDVLTVELGALLHDVADSKFHHGETVAEVNGNFYKVHHSKIYKTDAEGTLTMDDHHHPTNAQPFDLSITKNVFVVGNTIVEPLKMFCDSITKSQKRQDMGPYQENTWAGFLLLSRQESDLASC